MVFLISLMKLSLGRSLLSLCYSTHQISSEVEYHRSYIVYFSGPVEEKKIFINTYLVIVQMIITHYYNKPLVKYHKHKKECYLQMIHIQNFTYVIFYSYLLHKLILRKNIHTTRPVVFFMNIICFY